MRNIKSLRCNVYYLSTEWLIITLLSYFFNQQVLHSSRVENVPENTLNKRVFEFEQPSLRDDCLFTILLPSISLLFAGIEQLSERCRVSLKSKGGCHHFSKRKRTMQNIIGGPLSLPQRTILYTGHITRYDFFSNENGQQKSEDKGR